MQLTLCNFLQSVHKYVTQEFTRACLIAYESLPTDVRHPGWGRPGALDLFAVLACAC